jgi:hypothetical protein
MRTRGGMTGNWLGLGMAVLGLAGCATMEPPDTQMALAETAISQAQQSDAASHAPVELQMAREKMQAARAALDRRKFDEARRLAEKAAVDARLAESKARTAQVRQSTQELRESIETLRQEIQRRQDLQK